MSLNNSHFLGGESHRDSDGPLTEEKNVPGNFIRIFSVKTKDDITKNYMDLKNCG